uniref:Allantoate transporter n=1 Tax=Kwoniella dejecticola CBS 10117 TaxID=1296121 RepID=A0A1A6A1Z2_9TREE|nr:allantoate transporter [Kwoniella dejecticola CBS 10117]OBR84078.1 allantoate transporter [Kwoniella dejecticola CBS 10117]
MFEEKKDIEEQVDGTNSSPVLEEKKRHTANNQLDEAAAYLAQAGHVEYTAEERKAVIRKIDLFVCVPMCLTYFLQQLDKSSLSYAAIFDIQAETNLVGSQYSWLSSVVYIAQLCLQPASSYALIAFPIKYWVTFNMLAWSIVTVCTGAAKNFTGLVICRLLLGIFEATILPSFIFLTQMWYTRREQSFRTIAYQIANSFAAILGPIMSFGIGKATENSSTVKEYQGIFFFIGSVSVAFVPVIFFMLPNSPGTARFLRKGNDRVMAIDRLKENQTGTKSSKWKWNQVWETYKDPKTYIWAAMYFCTSTPSGGFGAFGGLVVKGLGFTSFKAILMQAPTGAIAILTLLITIFLTNQFRARWAIVAACVIPPIAGAVGLVKVQRSDPYILLACYYVAQSLAGIQPLLYSWANLNQAGSTKRVVVFATMFVAQCTGNIVGPQVYLQRENPYYHTGLYVNIGCWTVLFCLIVFMRFYLSHLNRKQVQRRVGLGLPADLKDMSIMPYGELEAYKAELAQQMTAAGLDAAKLMRMRLTI